MPIPKPNSGESQNDFISRCMRDDTMTAEYQPKQRTAICYAAWNKKEVEVRGIKEALSDFGGWIIDKFRKDTGAFDEASYSKEMEEMAGDEEGDKTKKTEDGISFSASDYAVVPDEAKPSTWKLRLAQDRSGNFTVAQVGMAITAMQPGGFRGNKVELSPEDKTQAISRISAAINKTDGDDNQKKNLRTRLNRVKELEEAKELPEVKSSFWITKDAEGNMRWIGFPSNKWRDRDNPPQIISEEAHKEFVEYLDKTKDYPVLLSWHTPGTRLGQAEWAEYDHGFLIMGGLVDADKHTDAERLMELCKKEAIGMSHGFVYSYADKEKEIIGKYRTWEVSHLPLSKAANVWTSIDILRKETKEMPLSDEKKAYLVGLHGQEVVDSILSKTADLEKDLVSAGIEFKDMVEPEVIEKEADPKQVAEALVEGEAFKAIATGIAGLTEAIKELKEVTIPEMKQEFETKIAEVETKAQKSADDIIADAMKSRSSAFQPSKEGPAPTEGEKEELGGPQAVFDPGFIEAMTGVNSLEGTMPSIAQ